MTIRLSRRKTLVALATIPVLALTACGSDDAATGAGKVPAKTIGVWQSQASGEGEKQTLSAIRSAAKAAGWKVVVTDSNGDPKAMQSTMQSLVTQRVDAILAIYLASGLVTQQLSAAKAADIPVISVGYQSTPAPNVTAEYAPDQAAMATMLMERMGKDLPDGGKIGPLAVAGYYGIDQELKVLKDEAPKLKLVSLEPVNVPVTDIFGGTTKASVDVLNGNPDLAALFSAGDFGVQAIVPALKQTGRKVPIYSFGAIPAALTYVRQGGVIIVTSDGAKSGYMAVDALIAYFVDKTPIPAKAPSSDAFQYSIVDKTNAPTGDEVYPEADFAKKYQERWASAYDL